MTNPTRIKQDRSRKSGYSGSLSAQDFAQQVAAPEDLLRGNIENAQISIGTALEICAAHKHLAGATEFLRRAIEALDDASEALP